MHVFVCCARTLLHMSRKRFNPETGCVSVFPYRFNFFGAVHPPQMIKHKYDASYVEFKGADMN